MEELLSNIFVQCVLPIKMDERIWRLIAQQPPSEFQHQQILIYELLTSKPKLKKQYFQQFQQNHLNLYGWSLLVSREKADIQPYLFSPLLQHTPSFHNSKLSHALQTYSKNNSRTEPTQTRKTFVPSFQRKEDLEIGGRELFLQTFAACRGQRYIPYDYARHVKGEKDRAHYNAFIRQNHARNHSNPTSPRTNLSNFAQWQQSKEKTAFLTFRKVLQNKNLNSQHGLQRMLKRQGSHKLVFVNHQRKPVNYYLRSRPMRAVGE